MRRRSRIVNGKTAPRPIPWQASLWYPAKGKFPHGCGGSILDKYTILTAKHCIHTNEMQESEFDKIFVMVGSTKVQAGQNILVDRVILYDNDLNDKPWDVAILKLSSPITFNRDVQPICLPESEQDSQFLKRGLECFVSGWGSLQHYDPELGPMPTDLQWTKVRLTDPETCHSHLNKKEDLICVGSLNFTGPCIGDSGGPLTCMKGSDPILVGIANSGSNRKCGHRNSYTYYASTVFHNNWIRRYMVC